MHRPWSRVEDAPCDGSISQIATIDQRKTVDDATGHDQSPVDTMDDGPLLLERIDFILIDVRGRSHRHIVHAAAVLDVTTALSLLVCVGIHGVEMMVVYSYLSDICDNCSSGAVLIYKEFLPSLFSPFLSFIDYRDV